MVFADSLVFAATGDHTWSPGMEKQGCFFVGMTVSHEFNKSFYATTGDISTLAAENKTTAIRALLDKNTEFIPAYLFAYDQVLQDLGIEGCLQFFSEIAAEPRCRYLANWMLARTQYASQNASAAINLFLPLVLDFNHEVPAQLLWEFLKICQSAGFSCLNNLSPEFISNNPAFHALDSKIKSQNASAVKQFQKYFKTRNEPDSFLLHLYIGSLRLQRRTVTPADSLLTFLIERAARLGDRYSETIFRHDAGRLHFIKREYQKAISAFRNSLAVAQNINNTTFIINNFEYIGHAYKMVSKYDSALVVYQAAEKYALKSNDKNLMLSIFKALGKQHYLKAEYVQYIASQALVLF